MDVFKVIAETNEWQIIYPEIGLGILGLFILMIGICVPNKSRLIPRIAIIGQSVILILTVFFLESPIVGNYFGGLIHIGPYSQIMRIFFLLSSMLVSYLGMLYLSKQKLPRAEFYVLILIVTGALMLLVQSFHFVMLFIALETVTIGLLILIAYCRTSEFSLEGGLKFLILGALSSSLLLFGIVLLYGVAGNPLLPAFTVDSMNFSALTHFISENPDNLLIKIGAILVICGLAFKIGIFPFQIWIPDVYQGAPTPITAFLAVSSKAAGIMVLLNLVYGPFFALYRVLIPLLSAIAIITILFANIAVLSQTNVKRLMGLSGVSHAGYLLIGVIASFFISWAPTAIVFYLFTYLLGSFAVFCVMGHMAGFQDEDQNFYNYDNLAKQNPFLGTTLLVGLGSLAGIPPFAGFIAKLLLFIAAFQAQLYLLLFVAALGVAISIYYYFGWLRNAFFYIWKDEVKAPGERGVVSLNLSDRIVLGVIIAFTLLLGIYQGVIGHFIF